MPSEQPLEQPPEWAKNFNTPQEWHKACCRIREVFSDWPHQCKPVAVAVLRSMADEFHQIGINK